MSDSDLKVDYDFLAESEKKLGQLKKTFEDIENRRDDMHNHWGSGKIADVMDDFVDNWDDYRAKLIDNLDTVGQMVAGTKKAFEDLDNQLANRDKKKQTK